MATEGEDMKMEAADVAEVGVLGLAECPTTARGIILPGQGKINRHLKKFGKLALKLISNKVQLL